MLATDPEPGERTARRALATIIGSGSKHLVEITVDPATEREAVGEGTGSETEGEQAEQSGVPGPVTAGDAVIATDGHPFWVPDLGQWVDAVDLAPGMWLQTSAGTWVQVSAVQAWTQAATVHNLTVQGVHTFHVTAGVLDVLNHNCNTTVGRWMSEGEYQAMSDTGKVQAGSGRTSTYVAHSDNSDAYRKQAAPGSIYAEFDVPCSCLKPAGEPGWAQIPGPQHPIYAKLNAKRGLPPLEMPSSENLRIAGRK
ncbi:HINT domain-containing protein [Nocardiopsis dassonvillei]|uniref:TreTu family toxin n=1 Tax=Nocardiopsis dassonvillei TaxID=2014 RepID=UPI0010D26B9F|nr:polymorphic toxin-type HINT domain-containing protein [Nocardiopsis dassonvillei]MCP3017205.1 HINT domain-containing protein [Nocardiopsis dassonvillei]